jgi:hypothetical protein
MKYWLATYDTTAWRIFMELDRSAVGAKRPRPYALGDIFLTYVRRDRGMPGQWTSGQRVVGAMFFDERELYPAGVWPYRWDVEPATPRFESGCGLVAKDLIQDMHLFRGLDDRTWGSALRSDGREIPAEDGEYLVDLLRSLAGDPVPVLIRKPSSAPAPVAGDGHTTRRSVSVSMRYDVLKRGCFRCAKCGRSPATESGVQLQVDHVIPWSRGGETVLENLQVLCAECNSGKSNRHAD